MARAKARAERPPSTPRARRRSARNQQQDDAPRDKVPDVFQEMLAEEAPRSIDEQRPLKKRKVEETVNDTVSQSLAWPTASSTVADREDNDRLLEDTPRLQTIIDESETDDSDVDWEDVDLDRNNADYLLQPLTRDQAEETLQIEIGNDGTKNKPARARRKAATAAERVVRLHIHKMHVLCLLYHSHIRNAWCNDQKVQSSLKRFLSVRLNDFFTPDPNQSQSQASKAFLDGLTLAKEAWKKFKITSVGMKRAKWAHDRKELETFRIPANADPVMDITDFQRAAVAFEGSADTGAMLFCAFLRATGVETRLVCSLQALPFTAASVPAAETTPKDKGDVVCAENSSDDKATLSPKTTPLKRITRIGRPGLGSSSHRQAAAPPPVTPKKTISHPRYPVYWVEAFNAAQQKWVTVDPIATGTIGKPSRLEPPLSDPDVCMSYVVAFERDGVAKDVTRRYAKAYNAKTRKSRVESTENGEKWWRKALKLFRRRAVLDRDQVEDAELARREAQEEMPKNVQDFKAHPYYVLERHLRHNEIIHPKHEVGKVNVGTTAHTNLEPIYRRRDVHQLKSADKWYRLGRDVKPGEQPLKHAKPRRSRQRQPFDDDEGEEEGLGTALYAPFQTELYVPPPCVRGRVPRNAFGNLDVYVPSMVPPGGVHIRDQRARQAARLLGIDYADAVTGFNFRGRHGTAIIEGVVVAEEFSDAMHAVLEGFRDVELEDEQARRSREALRMWKKFMLGLRVLERVQEYASADEKKQMEKEMKERIEAEEREEEKAAQEEMAGGFVLADAAGQMPAEPTAGRMVAAARQDDNEEHYDGGGGFLPEDANMGEGREPNSNLFRSRIMDEASLRPSISQRGLDGAGDEHELVDGGGFVPDEETALAEDVPDDGGGFIPEDGGGFVPEDGGGFITGDDGGFLPDRDEGEGGGFLQEDNVPFTYDSTYSQGPGDHGTTMSSIGNPGGSGMIATTVSTNNDASQRQESIRDSDEVSHRADNDFQDLSMPSEPQPQMASVEDQSSKNDEPPPGRTGRPLTVAETVANEQSTSDDERDSLPSHDPEDEDAEPEWLAEEVVSD